MVRWGSWRVRWQPPRQLENDREVQDAEQVVSSQPCRLGGGRDVQRARHANIVYSATDVACGQCRCDLQGTMLVELLQAPCLGLG